MAVKYKIIDAALDQAAETAKTDAPAGVELVIAMLNAAMKADDASEVQHVMDGANRRGFAAQFWPAGAGRVKIKVSWVDA